MSGGGTRSGRKNKNTFSNFDDFYKKIEENNIDADFQVIRNNGDSEKWKVYRLYDDRHLLREEDGTRSRFVRTEWHGGEDYENIYETYPAKVFNEKLAYGVWDNGSPKFLTQNDFIKNLREDKRVNFQDIKSIKIINGTSKESKYK